MSILFSTQIKNQIITEITDTTSNLQIISAYCKEDAVRFIEDSITTPLDSKKLMVRFTLDDILSGASDVSVYEYCKAHEWQIYLRFDLHAKTYVFDNKRCIVGSANLTSKGIGLCQSGNYEIATLAEMNDEERQKIDSLFNTAILMTDELYNKMKLQIEIANQHPLTAKRNWSEDILSLFVPDFSVLFTYDLPNCLSPHDLKADSLEFLNIPLNSSIDEIKYAFRWSKAFLWLCDALAKNNNELYFGSISEKLHNVLVNDPKPYRKEVKELQQNLLNWIIELGMDSVVIDRPNYSQRITLKDQVLIR